ncbi:RES domain-containing protein [Hyunsoonleella sp. 2307UL5-6]|uniref:RES domain-containing protein n=1 Tax=Hyunsoonleella sp. 2307UL5-6 TaxID=3384768 RepID=UPI0039BC52CA
MNCCVNCFTSSYLISIINGDDRTGTCDFCSTENTSIYSARELSDFFRNILSLYVPDENSVLQISESLREDFNIISEIVTSPTNLLKAIFEDEMDDLRELFENNVSFQNKSLLEVESHNLHNIWNDFKKEIKFENRYHIQNTIDLKKLKTYFLHESFYKKIKKGRIFFRCRVSDKNGFSYEKMGNPPTPELASAGRANPKGISYLYIADSPETSMYETRASLFDYVTVGEFKLKEDIKVLNLRNPKDDPMYWSEFEEIENYLIYIPFIQTLQKELSLPIRKRDKILDYIPTQYISEFIKSLGFDGVEYQSSLNSDGYNIAIFNPRKLECFKTNVYEIKDIKLTHGKIK